MGGKDETWSGTSTFVFSRALQQSASKHITTIGENWKAAAESLRRRQGKDLWHLDGGPLFWSLLRADSVDTIDVAIVPTILGGGIRRIAAPAVRIRLTLTCQRVYGTRHWQLGVRSE